MSWQRILLSVPGDALSAQIVALFAQQRAAWPLFRAGEAALAQLRTRLLDDGRASILVQANPARRASTHANVDARAIAARPCFLCPENMPAEEQGVAFEDLIVLPNPFPILPLHCTIADREHRPQQLAGRVGQLLRLAAAVGPELAVFYNGPRCGASAPDHLHFQACSAAGIPLLDELGAASGVARCEVASSFGRSVVVFADEDARRLEGNIERTLAQLAPLEPLRRGSGDRLEPMVNVIASYSTGKWTVLLFPRAAHRPACYFAEGERRLAISPAALEMAGILVAAEVDDLARIDAAVARKIYEEVSVRPEALRGILAQGAAVSAF